MQQYNTQLEKLPLPEYGRSIQNMVNHCKTIEDQAERQSCAETIISIMSNIYPDLKDNADFVPMLWDHLAIMSNYKLDVVYPCEIIPQDKFQTKPDPIPYLKGKVRYRHYGRLIEQLIAKTIEMPESEEKDYLIMIICLQMKKFLLTWNKESYSNEKIADDLEELSDNKLTLTQEVFDLMLEHDYLLPSNNSNTNNSNGIQKRRQPSNQKRGIQKKSPRLNQKIYNQRKR